MDNIAIMVFLVNIIPKEVFLRSLSIATYGFLHHYPLPLL